MCDTMVNVGPGGVLFAKNSDRDPNEAQLLEWHAAADHRVGATVRCTYLTIPQVAHTHAVLLSRPFWMWGAEMGTNEHGVTIGNEAVFTDQPYAANGLLGMDLLRLALERAPTAEEAVGVITGLLEAHGQGGGCGHEDRGFTYHNSFIVADPSRAFVLETAGRLWATEEVHHGTRSISNGLTIEGFARAHSDRVRSRVSACATRRRRTEAGAGTATGPSALAAVLRDHGPDRSAPEYALLNGAMAAPCMHAGGLVAASQTTASWISQLRGDDHRHWATGTAAPCTGIFLPVAVDAPADLGPVPDDHFDPATLWWRHEVLHRTAVRSPAAALPLIAAARAPLEAVWFEEPVPTSVALREADEVRQQLIGRLRSSGSGDQRPWHVRRYWRPRDRSAGVPVGGRAVTTRGAAPRT